MRTTTNFFPDYAIAPGETLLETLEELGLSQKELALRMGRPEKTICGIIAGKVQITPETALELEKVTGAPASIWNTLEAQYRETLARLSQQKERETQIDWLKQFSYSQTTTLRILPQIDDKTARVEQLLQFLGVPSPDEWEATYLNMQGAARETKDANSELGDLSIWLRCGELLARDIQCADYEKKTFLQALATIRSLTSQPPASVWDQVRTLCASAGVALVLVPELPKTRVSGFTRWLTPRKALIQLSLRYKTDDHLWFTFFHEAAHILLHGKKEVFLEGRGIDSPKEREADQWASDFLIPPDEWQAFLATLPPRPTATIIHAFAKKLSIAPSIPLGRLQHRDKRVSPGLFNSLKHKVEINWTGIL
jgi:HTH-type transcriptional regulator/antitoxin HigA